MITGWLWIANVADNATIAVIVLINVIWVYCLVVFVQWCVNCVYVLWW